MKNQIKQSPLQKAYEMLKIKLSEDWCSNYNILYSTIDDHSICIYANNPFMKMLSSTMIKWVVKYAHTSSLSFYIENDVVTIFEITRTK